MKNYDSFTSTLLMEIILLLMMALPLIWASTPYPWTSMLWVAGVVLLLPVLKACFLAKNFLVWNVLEYLTLTCLLFFAPGGVIVTAVWGLMTLVYLICGMIAVTNKCHA